MLPAFANQVNVGKIRVRAPKGCILLCGGKISKISDPAPLSIRDAYYKIGDNPPFRGNDLILAEDTNLYYVKNANYPDLLKFEQDLAQLCELVMLFCESESSCAELGAFSVTDEIARKLLVIIRSQFYHAESFISLGPLKALRNIHNDSVFAIDDSEIGIVNGKFQGIDRETLKNILKDPVIDRLEQVREHTTFDRSRFGHLVKLMVGVVQEFGALTLSELQEILSLIIGEVSVDEIARHAFCAEALNWVKEERIGSRDIIFACNTPYMAADFAMEQGSLPTDRARRSLILRDHWKQSDFPRFKGIVRHLGGTS